jgi:ribosome biogenesis protein YTM1
MCLYAPSYHVLQLWDLRSNVPLATLATHSDKVLCVAWPSARMLLSGSADCQLHSHAMETAYSA